MTPRRIQEHLLNVNNSYEACLIASAKTKEDYLRCYRKVMDAYDTKIYKGAQWGPGGKDVQTIVTAMDRTAPPTQLRSDTDGVGPSTGGAGRGKAASPTQLPEYLAKAGFGVHPSAAEQRRTLAQQAATDAATILKASADAKAATETSKRLAAQQRIAQRLADKASDQVAQANADLKKLQKNAADLMEEKRASRAGDKTADKTNLTVTIASPLAAVTDTSTPKQKASIAKKKKVAQMTQDLLEAKADEEEASLAASQEASAKEEQQKEAQRQAANAAAADAVCIADAAKLDAKRASAASAAAKERSKAALLAAAGDLARGVGSQSGQKRTSGSGMKPPPRKARPGGSGRKAGEGVSASSQIPPGLPRPSPAHGRGREPSASPERRRGRSASPFQLPRHSSSSGSSHGGEDGDVQQNVAMDFDGAEELETYPGAEGVLTPFLGQQIVSSLKLLEGRSKKGREDRLVLKGGQNAIRQDLVSLDQRIRMVEVRQVDNATGNMDITTMLPFHNDSEVSLFFYQYPRLFFQRRQALLNHMLANVGTNDEGYASRILRHVLTDDYAATVFWPRAGNADKRSQFLHPALYHLVQTVGVDYVRPVMEAYQHVSRPRKRRSRKSAGRGTASAPGTSSATPAGTSAGTANDGARAATDGGTGEEEGGGLADQPGRVSAKTFDLNLANSRACGNFTQLRGRYV